MTHATLREAKLAIMRDAPYVRKAGKFNSEKAKYSYASERDFIAKIRPLMEREQIDLSSSIMQPGPGHIVVTWKFHHFPSGEEETIQTIGEVESSGGKGFYKAQTGAFKYALRLYFLVETGDDPDRSPAPSNEKKIAEAQAWIMDSADLKMLAKRKAAIARDLSTGKIPVSIEKPLMDAVAAREKQLAAT